MRPTFDMLSSTSIVPWRPPEPEPTNAESSTTAEAPAFDLQAMLETMRELMAEPVLLGTLHGAMIYLDRTKPEGELVARDGKTGEALWRVSVRHPMLAGTKLVAAAEAYL